MYMLSKKTSLHSCKRQAAIALSITFGQSASHTLWSYGKPATR